MTAEREDDLRTTVDSLAADADQLEAIEREKASLEVDDPKFMELAEEATRLGERLRAGTRAQERLAREVAEE